MKLSFNVEGFDLKDIPYDKYDDDTYSTVPKNGYGGVIGYENVKHNFKQGMEHIERHEMRINDLELQIKRLNEIIDADVHLRNQYPALQHAWDEYNFVKNLCYEGENENTN